jgi:hypothetical protein
MSRPVAQRRLLAAAVQAALVASAPALASAAGLEFDPWVGAAVGYIHNIELNPNDQPHSDDFVAEAEAGFRSSYRSQRLVGALNYNWRGVNYFNENQWDSSYHNLGLNGQFVAVENLFFVQGNAFYRQALVDARGSPSFGGYFQPGNIQDSWGWSVTPTLNRDFGYVTLLARYTYGEVNFDESTDFSAQDSTTKSGYVSLATSDPREQFTWRVFYLSDRTEYENFLPYRYDQAGVDLGYAINSDLRLVGEYGLETDLTETATDGGLDSSYWMAGVVWEPDERNTLEARVGERFWGNSYFFNFRHRARYLELTARYSETPTTNTNRRVAPPDGLPPGELPEDPDFPDFDDQRLEPFILKSAHVSVAAVGQLTRVQLSYTDNNREYLFSGREEDWRLTQFSVDRELSSNSSARVWYTRRNRIEDGERDTLDNIFAARYSREIGRDITASAETAYQIRSEEGRDNADGWWIGLRVRKDF